MVLSSVGEVKIPDYDPRWIRLANGFGGGIAKQEDLCGVIPGAVMVFGALYGRMELNQDETLNLQLGAEFYRRFQAAMGATNCRAIKDLRSSEWKHRHCAHTVRIAVKIILDLLAETEEGKWKPEESQAEAKREV